MLSSLVVFADYNDVIKSTLSNIFSGSASANYFNIIDSDSLNIFLYYANFITFSSFYISISSFSNLTTSANNYSSKPSNVTVKLITVTFINTSGKYFGFGIFVVINNLKLLSKSISASPNFINILPSDSLYYFYNIVSIDGSKFSSISYINIG